MSALDRTKSIAIGCWIAFILICVFVEYSSFAAGVSFGATWAALSVWRGRVAQEG